MAKGTTAAQYNRDLVEKTGRGIRKFELLAGFRHAKGLQDSGVQVRNTRPGFFPDPKRMAPAKTTILRRYSFEVEVRGKGWRRGSENRQFVTVRTEKLLTREEIHAEAIKAIEKGQREKRYGPDFDPGHIVIQSARTRS